MKNFLYLFVIAFVLSACVSNKPEVEIFTVNLGSPQIPMGEIDVQFNRTFPLPGIKKGTVTVSYYPKEDAVCLRYRFDLMTYYQFWSRNGRAAFLNALAKYKDAYEARSLNRRGGAKEYGAAYGYLIWQLHRLAVQAKSNVNVEIGYAFKDNAPYFMTTQKEGYYEDPVSRDQNRESIPIPIYFTRAQANELAVLFDQEYLQALSINNTYVDSYPAEIDSEEDDSETDDYYQADEY